jgi:hypothetical protein
MEGQLSFLHFAVLACAFVFGVSFFTALYATLLAGIRTEAAVN